MKQKSRAHGENRQQRTSGGEPDRPAGPQPESQHQPSQYGNSERFHENEHAGIGSMDSVAPEVEEPGVVRPVSALGKVRERIDAEGVSAAGEEPARGEVLPEIGVRGSKRSREEAEGHRERDEKYVHAPSCARRANGCDLHGRNCGRCDHAFHTATCPVRSDWFARWAAPAELTPASAGQLGFFRNRTASTQFARCSNSPSGLS